MKLLYICHRFPYPPNKGCKIRAFHTIEHLAKHHDVWCATFVDDPADMQYVPAMKEFCREVVAIPLDRLRATVRGAFDMAIDETLTEGFYRSRAMRDAICELTSRVKFDGVVVFSSSMGQYARSIDAGIKIIDLCDLDSQKWAAMANRARALAPGSTTRKPADSPNSKPNSTTRLMRPFSSANRKPTIGSEIVQNFT
ncbi:MAG: hypothetical protein R3E58_16635 [Phycisphaerae bacterium]